MGTTSAETGGGRRSNPLFSHRPMVRVETGTSIEMATWVRP